jgi:hypothetical protein
VVRRLAGVVIILVACFGLLTVEAFDRLRVGGAAGLPSGTPFIGSCTTWISDPVDHPVTAGLTDGDPSSKTGHSFFYPSASIADCGQPHGGLLISVDYSTNPPDTATLTQIDSQDSGCRDDVNGWLAGRGLVSFNDYQGSTEIGWAPAVTFAVRSVGPDTVSRAAGGAWWGCALADPREDLPAGPNPTLPGMCLGLPLQFLADLTWSDGTVESTPRSSISCDEPHPGQVLAIADGLHGDPSRAQVDQSCQVAARRYIGTSDPGFGNSIMIQVAAGEIPLCYAEAKGDHLLDGSLLGLGNRPLPWVP